jgi:prolyl-tRNA editing enzyme YbaK/EbsC (Cys-tRNA(Pro) deacylase)
MNIAACLRQRHCWHERLPHAKVHTARDLAARLHESRQNVAKTVLLRAGDGEYAVAVLPANKTIDLQRASELLGATASLATEAEIARQCLDGSPAVIVPFGSRYGMQTIVDSNLAQDEKFVFEASADSVAIRIRFLDFLQIERPVMAFFSMINSS